MRVVYTTTSQRNSYQDLGLKKFAPPGNRTRVARMGILHDTTTPAALQYASVNFNYLNMEAINKHGEKLFRHFFLKHIKQ